MSREEREDAIDIIQSILDKYEEDECLVTEITIGDEDIKAFKMAIKALEQEPFIDKINKMKSEIADSLEFWDYSPNNNPLARDMLETITNFWGDMREVEK
jgi:hypothetical protein